MIVDDFLQDLDEAIAFADEIGYNLEDYVEGKALRDELQALSEEIDFTLNVLPEREELEDLYNRASGIGKAC